MPLAASQLNAVSSAGNSVQASAITRIVMHGTTTRAIRKTRRMWSSGTMNIHHVETIPSTSETYTPSISLSARVK